jgi:hypothetical protein
LFQAPDGLSKVSNFNKIDKVEELLFSDEIEINAKLLTMESRSTVQDNKGSI